MTITRVTCLAALAAVAVAWSQPCSAADAPGAMPIAGHDAKGQAVPDGQGNLHVPSHYLTTYEFLGTWAVAAKPEPGSKEIHNVYANPGTIAAFRKDGHFPDGTVLVKEVYATATAPMTTGTVSHADQLKGWFVMVRDGGNNHPGNPLWGDGWGWSWFDAGNAMKTTSTDYKKDCIGCHLPAQATDWIYTSGYPVLK
jgi:hypothetical protein